MTQPIQEPVASTQEQATTARLGVPVWRVGKPDTFLANDVAVALDAVRSIADEGAIGAHRGVYSEGIRVVTHVFDCNLAGYVGWQWFASLTRLSRSRDVTVNEVGLLPTDGSVLAPPWVPWSERVRPEDAQGESDDVDSDAADEETGEAAAEDAGEAPREIDPAQTTETGPDVQSESAAQSSYASFVEPG